MRTIRKHPLAFGAAAFLFIVAVATGLVAVPSASSDTTSTYSYLKLFSEVMALIRHKYVESIEDEDLLRGAYEGLLASLDGESEYLTAAQYNLIQASVTGASAESGLFLTRRDGILFVAAVMPGSDAEEKGFRLGDQIRRIGATPGRELSLSQAEKALRGPPGKVVKVAVSRREDPRRDEIDLELKELSLPEPEIVTVKENVAVVRIGAFGAGSSEKLSEILTDLGRKGVDRILFDLRGNAWGAPEEAVAAASLFTGEGVVALLTERGGAEEKIVGSGPKSGWSGVALLLTDPGTAYAAEIFIAALVDSGVASQGGEKTLGRGGEREVLRLANGDYLLLTVKKYLSPTGNPWHGQGLEPAVSIPADRSVAFEKRSEEQLLKAVEWLREQEEEQKAA